MSIPALREAIVTGLKARLGLLAKSVQAHGGRFNAEEVKRYSAQVPAVFVACVGIGAVDIQGGMPYAALEWVAFALVTDAEKAGDRTAKVLALGGELTRVVSIERWGIADAGRAEMVSAQNVYSAELDKLGAALWFTRWRQSLPLLEATAEELGSFTTFVSSYDLAPKDGTVDAVDNVTLEE